MIIRNYVIASRKGKSIVYRILQDFMLVRFRPRAVTESLCGLAREACPYSGFGSS